MSDDFLAQARDAEPAAEFADPDSVGIVLFTSGTTSQPKAVELTHNNLTSYVTGTVEFGSAEPTDAALICVPPYHIAGVSAALSNLYAGRKMVYLPVFDPEEWVRLVDAEHVTSATVVPTMLDRIVTVLERGVTPAASLRNLAYGGSKVGLPLVRTALELLPGVGFVNAYGLTETSSTIAVLTPDDHREAHTASDPAVVRRLGSVGQPVPSIEVQIRDENGTVLGPGETGELFVRGDQVSGRYTGIGSVLDAEGGFRPRTSPPSTRMATCSSPGAATTPSSGVVRTSHPPKWKTCWSNTRTSVTSQWLASRIRSGARRSSRWWCRSPASTLTPRNCVSMSARACGGRAPLTG